MSPEKITYSPTNALVETQKLALEYYASCNHQLELKAVFNCNWWTTVFVNMQLFIVENGGHPSEDENLIEFRDLAYKIWRDPDHILTQNEAKTGFDLLNKFLDTPEDKAKHLR